MIKNIGVGNYRRLLKCAFHNPNVEYECEMTTDVHVLCSVKMRKMTEEHKK